ncbi:BolA-like protein DDB_G0274169 [Anthophora retusa]
MYKTKIIFRKNCKNMSVLLRNMSNVAQNALVESSIKKKLMESLNPFHIEIINESYMHNVPKGSETHFKVIVVSDAFKDVPLVKRHRMVNKLLQAELEGGVHALSIVAKTPDQWNENVKVTPSPACRGGFGR